MTEQIYDEPLEPLEPAEAAPEETANAEAEVEGDIETSVEEVLSETTAAEAVEETDEQLEAMAEMAVEPAPVAEEIPEKIPEEIREVYSAEPVVEETPHPLPEPEITTTDGNVVVIGSEASAIALAAEVAEMGSAAKEETANAEAERPVFPLAEIFQLVFTDEEGRRFHLDNHGARDLFILREI